MLQFSNATDVMDRNQQQYQPTTTCDMVKSLTIDWQCCGSILQYGDTPLSEAARGGHTATADALLKAGGNANATNKVRSNMMVFNYLIV